MEYSKAVLRHFRAPVNAGRPGWRADVSGSAGDRAGGLVIRFWLALESGRIARAGFAAYGCPHAVAVASWVTGRLEGQALADACRLDLPAVVAALSLPAEKWRCVLVAEDALLACRQALIHSADTVSTGY